MWMLVVLVVAACGEIAPQTIDAAVGPCEPGCDPNAACEATGCVCEAGFTGDGFTCTDINECETNNGGCDVNGFCLNDPGGSRCACNAGFLGDGLSCRQVWTRVGMTTLRLSNVVNGQTNRSVATAAGDRIYFAPDIGSDGDTTQHYLRYFDVQTMTFSNPLAIPPASESDFCACGYGQVFVSDGTNLFMFGNDGYRYNALLDSWAVVSGYIGGPFQRGEAAGAFEGNNNLIYMVGGRGPLDTAQRFSVASQTFTSETGNLPFALDSAVAWAPAGNNLLYVAGGSTSTNNRRYLLRHVTGNSTWTQLPEAPADIDRATGMGDYMGKIWVSTDDSLYFFDPATMTWTEGPIPVPTGFIRAVTAAGNTYALVQVGDMLEIHRLTAIE